MKPCSRGLTLVEVLIVVVVVVLISLALMPMSGTSRERARRAFCGGNLSQIGKAMYLYAGGANDGQLPRVAPFATGADSGNWLRAGVRTRDGRDPMGRMAQGATTEEARQNAVDAMFNPSSTQPYAVGGSPTASLFILMRNDFLRAKDLLCPLDRLAEVDLLQEAKLDLMVDVAKNTNCSYSLAMPWGPNVDWTLEGHPRSVLAADMSPVGVSADAQVRISGEEGNSRTHWGAGQNILHRDASVAWKSSNRCGIGDDNIFTVNTTGADADAPGRTPALTKTGGSGCLPRDTSDTVMIFYGRESRPIFPESAPTLSWVVVVIALIVVATCVVWWAMKRPRARADQSDT